MPTGLGKRRLSIFVLSVRNQKENRLLWVEGDEEAKTKLRDICSVYWLQSEGKRCDDT